MIHGKGALRIFRIRMLMRMMLMILGYKKVSCRNRKIRGNFLIIRLVKWLRKRARDVSLFPLNPQSYVLLKSEQKRNHMLCFFYLPSSKKTKQKQIAFKKKFGFLIIFLTKFHIYKSSKFTIFPSAKPFGNMQGFS